MTNQATLPSVSSTRHVRFRDLSVKDPLLKEELLAAVERILTTGQLIMGEEVERFEQAVADYCGTKYCVGMASGTDSLYLALRAFDIGPGDEVITTPMSWIATLNAIHLCGARPVFVDVGPDLNINADLINEALTPRTRAILPVHYTGRLAGMDVILEAARKHDLLVIEDAAQAFGAHLHGRRAGSFGDAAAFSFNPMKVLQGYGEAGAVLTNDSKVKDRLVAMRYLGTVNKEICYYPSLNAKIDPLQAAMMMASLKRVESIIARRIEVAEYYGRALKDVVVCPGLPDPRAERAVFFDYTIVAEHRDELKQHLEQHGVEVKIKHPMLMPDQPAYKHLGPFELPVAKGLVQKILCLPIHEKLANADLEFVASCIKSFYAAI